MRNARDANKQVTSSDAMEMLEQGEYGVLSTVDKAGQPYGVPLNYIIIDNAIYLHCTLEGHKLENIAANSNVCFTVINYSEIVPASFTAKYESVIVFGRANITGEKEKITMLTELVNKYSPDYQEKGLKVIEAFKDKCTVIRISIDHLTGMRKK